MSSMTSKGRFLVAFRAGSQERVVCTLESDPAELEERLAKELKRPRNEILVLSVHFKPQSTAPLSFGW